MYEKRKNDRGYCHVRYPILMRIFFFFSLKSRENREKSRFCRDVTASVNCQLGIRSPTKPDVRDRSVFRRCLCCNDIVSYPSRATQRTVSKIFSYVIILRCCPVAGTRVERYSNFTRTTTSIVRYLHFVKVSVRYVFT